MCGISGFNFHDPDLVARMNAVQRHRGPDDEGVFHTPRLSLGNRRLSILDLSEKGRQPMSTADGAMTITYNGEVYNFAELRSELEHQGVAFRSRSDTEVVLALYQRYGVRCLERLNGMFGFAIYDSRDDLLFLARDRLGIKPLYYYWDGRRFLFASELKALLEAQLPRKLHAPALAQFFTYRFNHGSETIFENFFKLPPGHFLVFDLGGNRIRELTSWWKIPLPGDGVSNDELEYTRELEELLFDAVGKRLVADVPLGFFLSGGIDSSIVTGIAARLGADLKTFSAGFETTDELPYAALASGFYGSDHQAIRIGDEALELFDEMVYHMDEPIGDAAFLATFVLSREASRKVKVVLAGEGADELFAGYDRYKVALYGDALSRFVPSFFKTPLTRLRVGGENLRRLARILGEATREGRYLEVIRLFSDEEMEALSVQAQSRNGIALPEGDLLQAIQYFDMKTVLPNDFFMKADKMSSAWGLEERVPFLDHRVVELACRLPRREKLGRGREKRILRTAFRELLPPEILNRRKHGFDVPMDIWLRGPLYHRLRKLLEEDVHQWYDKRPVLDLLERFRHMGGSYKASFFTAQKLWSILTFEIWYRRFV